MTVVARLGLTVLVACGGQPHPASPPFDAKGLAAELDHAMAEMAAIVAAPPADWFWLLHDRCAAIATQLDAAEQRARGPVERAREAQRDPQRAKQLTTELRAYNQAATGRSDAIAEKLAICFREHRELQDQIKHVVDSMPTL